MSVFKHSRWLMAVALIWLLGLFIRWPQFDRPLSSHHEFCTAVSLMVLQSWHAHGFWELKGNPSTSMGEPADLWIPNYAGTGERMVDVKGRYYYVSHPPLGYYLAYAWFTITGLPISAANLQMFHAFWYGLTLMGIALGLRWFGYSEDRIGFWILLGAYAFNPAVLWFQGNVYMSDMAVQPFFVGALLAWFAMYRYPQQSSVAIWIHATMVGLMVYTTWLGVCYLIAISMYGLWRGRKIPFFFKFWCTSAVMALLAFSLMAWQYSQIAGWNPWLMEMLSRGKERSFSGGHAFLIGRSWLTIAVNYGMNYGYLWIMFMLIRWRGLFYGNQTPAHPVVQPVQLGFLTILILHLLLPNYSGHDFTTLYAAVPLVWGMAIWIRRFDESLEKKWPMAIFIMISGIIQFHVVNLPGLKNIQSNPYDRYLREGESIRNQASSDETIFLMGEKPEPQTIWYAGRNLRRIREMAEVESFMTTYHPNGRAVVLQKDEDGLWQKIQVYP